MLIATGAVAAGASAAIVGTSGAVTKIDPPASVELGALESDTKIFGFDEQQNVTLRSPLAVDITRPGLVDEKADLTPGMIPAGTTVSSQLLHADRIGARAKPKLVLDGSATVDGEILGLVVQGKTLDVSDALGAPGTKYPGATRRALSFDTQEDAVTLSADRRTVTPHLQLQGHSDQVRIITAAGKCRKEDESSDDSSDDGDDQGDGGGGGDSGGDNSCSGDDSSDDD